MFHSFRRHLRWVKFQTFMVIIFVMVFSYWAYIGGKFLIGVTDDFISRSLVFMPLHKFKYLGVFKVTAYSDRVEETDIKPEETFTGKRVNRNSLAVSHDLYKKVLFPQDIVYIEEIQSFGVVDDLMADANAKGTVQRKWIDKFYFDRHTVDSFGLKKCHVYVVRD